MAARSIVRACTSLVTYRADGYLDSACYTAVWRVGLWKALATVQLRTVRTTVITVATELDPVSSSASQRRFKTAFSNTAGIIAVWLSTVSSSRTDERDWVSGILQVSLSTDTDLLVRLSNVHSPSNHGVYLATFSSASSKDCGTISRFLWGSRPLTRRRLGCQSVLCVPGHWA